jgi:hypothetical protein
MQYPQATSFPFGAKPVINRAGFQLLALNYKGPDALGRPIVYRELLVTTPFWFPVLLTLIAPACWLVARRRRRRRAIAAGLCPRCGHDLRATPGRCPECGMIPDSGSAPPARVPTA